MTSRREFLLSCCAAATANAQSASNYRALVCVFLFGGNDSNNVIIPLATTPFDHYRAARGNVALASTALLPINSPSQGGFGLHPNLAPIRDLYNQGRAAFVLNVGTLVRPTTKADLDGRTAALPRNLYSHSDQQLEWQAANPNGPSGTGWGGRAADAVRLMNPGAFPPSVSVTGNSSLQLTGFTTRPVNISPGNALGLETLGNGDLDKARDDAFQQILNFPSGASLIGSANAIVRAGITSAKQINEAMASTPALATVFPNTGLGNQLKEVARIISARQALSMSRQIFFVSQGGFDNHSDLLPQRGGLLTTLAGALNAFYQATVEMNVSGQVTTFTESEFNRTFTPNGNAGTDHAWDGHQIVIGGSVKSEVYGRMPDFTLRGPDDAGDRGLWIPSLSLDQYAATLAQWFGVSSGDLSTVFPNIAPFTTKNLGFLA